MELIKVYNLTKTYHQGENIVKALNDVSFTINEGEFVCILGSSGAGKSTLLNILGGMDRATSGSYMVNDEDITNKTNKELIYFRRDTIGFIFQFYNLMPNLTALENVMLSHPNVKENVAKNVLSSVGLEHRINNFPNTLSGGEQQRVSIARALVKSPKVLLCDEPTGALDTKTGVSIIELLYNMSSIHNKTVIVVTHNENIAKISKRVIKLSDGKIINNYINENPIKISDVVW